LLICARKGGRSLLYIIIVWCLFRAYEAIIIACACHIHPHKMRFSMQMVMCMCALYAHIYSHWPLLVWFIICEAWGGPRGFGDKLFSTPGCWCGRFGRFCMWLIFNSTATQSSVRFHFLCCMGSAENVCD
jgi:hypothetical protein